MSVPPGEGAMAALLHDIVVTAGVYALIGFEVTPEMAEFNRSGSRFRVNAGASQTQAAPSE